ncbi:LysR family transcriptional regulator [Brevibacterium sp. UCMA 11754]|uniref:LysR family transcriptional regulator n=1 Tax=Brevibacterium sp. UCMA 11754 TaxID=2749198 RepID=UPI001F484294|nr:LysR family transcriptional regulator [Brevibacterium sp. UCMA 11754]MCF2570827.1 LysR family transcriptional regulator [Brevibacterium sp. UCMA 11754]
MELRHLEYFVAVVDHGGVSRAAEALHVAQPTISQVLRVLERELKVDLFVRTGRRLTPSPAGLALVSDARKALRGVLAVTDHAREIQDAKTGILTITTMPELSSDALVSWASAFMRSNPELQYSISEADSAAGLATAVETGHSELGFTSLPIAQHPQLSSLTIGTQRLLLVAPPNSGHSLADVSEKDVVSISELPEIPIAVSHMANRENTAVAKVFEECGAKFAPQAICPNRSTQLAFVLSGDMFTFLPLRMALTAYRQGATIFDTDPLIESPFGFVFRRSGLSQAAHQLMESCQQSLKGWTDATENGFAKHGSYAAAIRDLATRG